MLVPGHVTNLHGHSTHEACTHAQIRCKNKLLEIDPIVITIKEHCFSKLMNRNEIGADRTLATALGKGDV